MTWQGLLEAKSQLHDKLIIAGHGHIIMGIDVRPQDEEITFTTIKEHEFPNYIKQTRLRKVNGSYVTIAEIESIDDPQRFYWTFSKDDKPSNKALLKTIHLETRDKWLKPEMWEIA